MHKKVLSEIDLHYGTINMPKGFEIDRDKLQKDILLSQIKIGTQSAVRTDMHIFFLFVKIASHDILFLFNEFLLINLTLLL